MHITLCIIVLISGMDMRVFDDLQEKPLELAAFLEESERRLRPKIRHLSVPQLSDMATAFREHRPEMYSLVCHEIRARIRESEPRLGYMMARNWTEGAKGYREE